MKALTSQQREAMRTFMSARREAELEVESGGGEVLPRAKLTVSWICRIIAAGIMLETLYFKFTAHPESVWIFTKMNMEAWGRYGQGVWELLAAVLLLAPRFTWLGAMLTLGAMGAAILSHIAVLGIAIQGDHGLLFGMACTTFLSAFAVLWIHQQSVPHITRLDDFPE
ncbi:MAG TPA: DoxX family protein [Verrucomicrobiota bacterium]|nr:DoxX family protein [Verrucomicrobiota bacterium]